MSALSEEQITLLRKAVARAKEIPEGFSMSTWVFRRPEAPCGTAGCLAFEICVANGAKPETLLRSAYELDVAIEAGRLIGADEFTNLFYVDEWPDDLVTAYTKAAYFSLKRALVLEQAVERWIEGGGRFE